MEDVVDADGFTSTEGVHPACSALLESVDHIAQHGVVNERVGDVVEVTAENTGFIGGVLLVGNGDSLSGTEHHAQHVVAEDGIEHAAVADAVVGIGILCLQLAGPVQGAVDACGFKVDVEKAYYLSIHVNICPHGALVGVVEENGFTVLDGIAAEHDHVCVACCHIGEIVLVTL